MNLEEHIKNTKATLELLKMRIAATEQHLKYLEELAASGQGFKIQKDKWQEAAAKLREGDK